MKVSVMKTVVLGFMLGITCCVFAGDPPFSVADGLYDQTDQNDLGLVKAVGTETVTVFAPSADTDHFSNGVCMIGFKGGLYCMWQSSQTDEDSSDTWVAYARSLDGGKTWSAPMVLAPTIDDGSTSSGGWIVNGDELIAFINTWNSGHTEGYTRYISSTDGLTWSQPAEVTMADGTRMEAVFEQDPHVLSSGRIVNAAHFAPGLHVYPIYTDDPSGKTGWHKAQFAPTDNGTQSRELEPSIYVKPDGTIVMMFRDQNSTYLKLASESKDNGETWCNSVQTNVPDSRSKQSAGNLPDGTSYFVSNPVSNKNRWPLVLSLSADGTVFSKAWLLRSKDEMQAMRYAGKAKREYYSYPKSMVYEGYLYSAYSTNKEDVEYTRVPLSSISLLSDGITNVQSRTKYKAEFTITGQKATLGTRGIVIVKGKKYIK